MANPGRHGRGGNRTPPGSPPWRPGRADELFAEEAKHYPQFAAYEAKTERTIIPVIILERA
jgi:hypothetical protein